MEWTGMLIVSLSGVNFGFWSRLGCYIHTYFIVTSPMGLFRNNYLNYYNYTIKINQI